MTRRTFALLLLLSPLVVGAQTIYKCIDANGGVVISNSRVEKNCKAIDTGIDNNMPAPRRPAASSASSSSSPGGFPRVQEDTQRARDNDRRHILEQELSGEQRNLDQAKKDLAEQEALRTSSERAAPYRDRVTQHERNIQAIQKELSALR